MNRLLQSVCRPSLSPRSSHFVAIPTNPKIFRPIAMAQLSNAALAHASTIAGSDTKPSTWQGVGAAEFDLRSMTESELIRGQLDRVTYMGLM
jgi:hypothetical protein